VAAIQEEDDQSESIVDDYDEIITSMEESGHPVVNKIISSSVTSEDEEVKQSAQSIDWMIDIP
jgi:CO dehydrogenase/acetyl-CoA synthase beta subunit